MRRAVSLVLVAFTQLVTVDAVACGGSACFVEGVLPRREPVPANVRGILWAPRVSFYPTVPVIDETSLGMYSRPAGGPIVPVPFTLTEISPSPKVYLVVPTEPFAVSSEYVLLTRRQCPGDAPGLEAAAVITTVEPAAPPLGLGAIVAAPATVGDLQVSTHAGSCSTTIRAVTVRLDLELSADAQPWASALSFETFVDGQKWDGRDSLLQTLPIGESWQGPARDKLYAACETEHGAALGLTEGSHSVVFRARVLGEGDDFESEPLDVELRCDAAPADEAERGGACAVAMSPKRVGIGAWLGVALALGACSRRRRRSG